MTKTKNLTKYIVFFLIAIMLVSTAFVFSGCNRPNYDNLSIKNWDNYVAIGAGTISQSSQTARVATTASMSNGVYATNNTQDTRLIGLTTSGIYQQIEFADANGNTTTQTMSVVNYKAFVPMTFVQFTEGAVAEVGDFSNYVNFEYDPLYVIDNFTGKIYHLGEHFYQLRLGYTDETIASNDAVYLQGVTLDDTSNGYTYGEGATDYLYKLSFSDGNLVVEKCIDNSKLNYSSYLVDKYNNVFLTDSNNDAKYLYREGTIKIWEHSIYRGMNGIVYSGSQWVNAEGELESATFVPTTTTYFPGSDLIYQNGNEFYYYRQKFTSNYDERNTIHKITKIDEVQYEYTAITMQDWSDDYAVVNEKLYCLDIDENEIFYIDIPTGQKYLIPNNNYVFNKIYADKQGNIIYEGVNLNLDNVTCTITPEGNITENVVDNGYQIFYITPIN